MGTPYVIHARCARVTCRTIYFQFPFARKGARPLPSGFLASSPRGARLRRSSFCMLDLRGITVAPLTTQFGLTSISCAPRYAVLDLSREQPAPAVFVSERQTNSAFGAWFTSLGFSAPHPQVQVAISYQDDRTLLRVESLEDGLLFAATVRPSAEAKSMLFSSPKEFGDFIAQGVSSYGLSRHGSRLTKVDLQKTTRHIRRWKSQTSTAHLRMIGRVTAVCWIARFLHAEAVTSGPIMA